MGGDGTAEAGSIWLPLAVLVAAALVVLVAGGFALALWRRRWTIADLPTSDAAHVFVGTNEVVGEATPIDQPLVAPFSASTCVWYRAVLEREVERNDRKSWRTVSDETSEAPFWIEDRTGRVLVRPKGASVHAPRRHRAVHAGRPERYGRFSMLRSLERFERGIEPAGAILPVGLDTARFRSTEWYLQPGETVYVLGDATMRDDAVALEFAPADPATGVRLRSLFVSAGDERVASRRTGWQALALLVATAAGAAAVPAAWHALQVERDGGPGAGDPSLLDAAGGAMVAAVGLVLAGLGLLYVARLFNRLVSVRNRARAAWALIDLHLRRRHDLLPALADVVAAAATHEREVQASLAALRAGEPLPPTRELPDGATLAQAEVVGRADHGRAERLVALAEAYPTLRAGDSYQALQAELVRTEDGIAFARRFYNDAVTVLRDRRHRFPGLLLAPLVPVPSLDLFTLDDDDLNELGVATGRSDP